MNRKDFFRKLVCLLPIPFIAKVIPGQMASPIEKTGMEYALRMMPPAGKRIDLKYLREQLKKHKN